MRTKDAQNKDSIIMLGKELWEQEMVDFDEPLQHGPHRPSRLLKVVVELVAEVAVVVLEYHEQTHAVFEKRDESKLPFVVL